MKAGMRVLVSLLLLASSTQAFAQKKPPKKPLVVQATQKITFTTSPGDVHAVRDWTDSTGEHTVEAALQRVEATHAIFLKDGKEFKLPVDRLSKPDQAITRNVADAQAFSQFVQDIVALNRKVTEFQGTSIQVQKFREEQQTKLENAYRGVRIRLTFHVANVFVVKKHFIGANKDHYWVDVNRTKDGVLERHHIRFRTIHVLSLTDKQALSVNKDSRLALSGNITFTGSRLPETVDQALTSATIFSNVSLDKLTYEIENPPARDGRAEQERNVPAKKPPPPPENLYALREWKEAKGNGTFTAAFRRVENADAVFVKDGKESKVPLQRLNGGDQKLLQNVDCTQAFAQFIKELSAINQSRKTFQGTEAQRQHQYEKRTAQLKDAYRGVRVHVVLQVANASFRKNIGQSGEDYVGLVIRQSKDRLLEKEGIEFQKDLLLLATERQALAIDKDSWIVISGDIDFVEVREGEGIRGKGPGVFAQNAILTHKIGSACWALDRLTFSVAKEAGPKTGHK